MGADNLVSLSYEGDVLYWADSLLLFRPYQDGGFMKSATCDDLTHMAACFWNFLEKQTADEVSQKQVRINFNQTLHLHIN